MVSLGQTAIFGIAGFTMANLVAPTAARDLTLESVARRRSSGSLVATVVGFVIGAIASRSEGIYFLMITLAFGDPRRSSSRQVTDLSGFGGLNHVDVARASSATRASGPIAALLHALVVAVVVYLLIRYVVRTPFGIALQGIRDDPTRMRALGYNVALHRTLAFAFGAFIAALAGILSVWWNLQISPGSIGLGATIDVLIIAVIGGLFRLEGAWVGAFVFVADRQLRAAELRLHRRSGSTP